MGDRGNIVLDYGDSRRIYLYTHWNRHDIKDVLRTSLARARDRWDDPPYLARIIFDDLIDGDRDTTGFGLDVELGDGDETAVVFLAERIIRYDERTYPYETLLQTSNAGT